LFSDPIIYISLVTLALFALALGALLVIIKIRNTAKVSFISFFAVITVVYACVDSIIHENHASTFNLLILLAAAFLMPYCIMLAFGKPKEKIVKESAKEEDASEKTVEVNVEKLEEKDINILDKGKYFQSLASDAFFSKDGMQTLLDTINKTSMDVAHADGGAVLIVDDFDDVIAVKSFLGNFPPPYKLPDDLPHKPLRVSTSFKYAQFPLRDNIFGEVASTGKAELITVPRVDDRIFQNAPEDFLKLGSLILIPLKLGDKGVVIGLIALSRNPEKDPFTEEDYDLVQHLAGFAESALKTTISFTQYQEQKELTKESDIASNLQTAMIPKKLPNLPGVSFGCYTEHASGVCSDIFDVVPARQDRTSFVLMDVAGKGANSVLVMTMLRAMLKLIVNTTQSAGTILTWANKGICSEQNFDHFASVVLINYDCTKHKVQFSTGGSIPVFRYTAAKGFLEKISSMCDPVGVEKATSYRDIEFTAAAGDVIITYSDGIVEALDANGKQYPEENIANIVKANSKMSGKDIANLIKKDIKKFIGVETLHDDQTLLVVKIQ